MTSQSLNCRSGFHVPRASRYAGFLLALISLCALTACGPNYSKITDDLRAQNLKLEKDLAKANRTIADRDAEITDLRDAAGPTTRVATLPEDKLKKLFVVDQVSIRKTTAVWDFDSDGKPDGYRVYVRTLSEGQVMPAAGYLKIEAFDLAGKKGEVKLGTWEFGPEDLKKRWESAFGLNCFALNCPWQAPTTKTEITFRVVFTDALTGRVLTDQTLIKLRPIK